MKKTNLIAVFLIAALTLSGCGIYTSTMLPGIPNEFATAPVVSAPEEVKQGPVAPAPVEPAPVGPAPVESAPVASTPADPVPAESKPVTPKTEKPAETQKTRLTKAEAEAAALKHAGFAAGQVTRLKSEPDFDERVPHYDVEFRVERWEYEYEIHAETGKILSFDKDD